MGDSTGAHCPIRKIFPIWRTLSSVIQNASRPVLYAVMLLQRLNNNIFITFHVFRKLYWLLRFRVHFYFILYLFLQRLICRLRSIDVSSLVFRRSVEKCILHIIYNTFPAIFVKDETIIFLHSIIRLCSEIKLPLSIERIN